MALWEVRDSLWPCGEQIGRHEGASLQFDGLPESPWPIRSSFHVRAHVAHKAVSPTFLVAFNADFFAASDPPQPLQTDSGNKSGRVWTGTNSSQSSARKEKSEKERVPVDSLPLCFGAASIDAIEIRDGRACSIRRDCF